MDFCLDTHNHTLASGHAYNTLNETVKAAADAGLALLGVTEHGPATPGSCHEFYFNNLRVIPRERYGVELLLGAEVNILDVKGRVDLPSYLLKKTDIVIASMHTCCITPGSRDENTESYLAAMKNPYVNIIGHPDDPRYPVDFEALVQCAKEYEVLLEINNSSLIGGGSRKNAAEQDRIMLEYRKKYGVSVAVGSDSHVDADVGRHDLAYELFAELDFPEELVVNTAVDKLKPFCEPLPQIKNSPPPTFGV